MIYVYFIFSSKLLNYIRIYIKYILEKGTYSFIELKITQIDTIKYVFKVGSHNFIDFKITQLNAKS